MRTEISPAAAKRLALAIAGLNVVIMLAGASLRIGFSAHLGVDWLRSVSLIIVAFVAAVFVYSVVAVLIISRYPRHALGWLYLIVGFFLAMVTVLSFLQALEPTFGFGPFLRLIWWASHLAFVPAFIVPLSLMLLFFPDGRLPSRRWWPIAGVALLGMCGGMVSIALYPWPWEEVGIEDARNPFAVAGSEVLLNQVIQLSFLLIVIGVVGSLAGVAVRFYRSQGVERLQMKWLVYMAVGGTSSLLILAPFLGANTSYGLFLSLPTLMAIAIGIAILRYRLWDIDVLIRRTLIYGALTGTLALFYFLSVVMLQRIFPAESQASIVLSTLAIAALFAPLRNRIQTAIDRRFYRSKYDAERTLASFGAALRGQVELDGLKDQLIVTVGDTIQPASVSLWLASESGLGKLAKKGARG